MNAHPSAASNYSDLCLSRYLPSSLFRDLKIEKKLSRSHRRDFFFAMAHFVRRRNQINLGYLESFYAISAKV